MTQSVLLVFVTALLTWRIMKWARWTPDRPKRLSPQEREAERAKEIGTQLDGARIERASLRSSVISWHSPRPSKRLCG